MDKQKKKKYCITVITCFPNHPTGVIPDFYKGKTFFIEYVKRIKIIRCKTYATPNKGIIKKLIGHLTFMFFSILQAGSEGKKADIILVSSPTFFSVFSAYWISKRYQKPFIFEVRDLWPAIFKELNIIKNKLILNILEYLELFFYEKAKVVVTVTRSFSQNIIDRGIPSEKVKTIKNGVNLSFFNPKIAPQKSLINQNLEEKFIVLYLGAHGISQGLEKIIDVAVELKDFSKIHFLFVGEGAAKNDIVIKAKKYDLKNISFIKGQAKNNIKYFYNKSDVVLVPLKNIPLFDTFIPSKIFEIMAMKKPIIASVRGESAEILKKSNAALISDPEDVQMIRDNIIHLYKNSKEKDKMGLNGLKFVKKFYSRQKFADKYETIFENILKSSKNE